MIRPLETGDRSRVETLLAENPFKADQVRIQRLNPEKLVRFHADRLLSRVGKTSAPTLFFQENSEFGVIGMQESQTHSIFFEKLVFSISPVLSYRIGTDGKSRLFRAVLEEVRTRGAQVVWVQFPEEESDWFKILSREGGVYCGTTLRLTRRLGEVEPIRAVQGAALRPAEERDLPRLESIAERGHGHSHFFRDPFLPEGRKRRLFPEYLKKSFGQNARELWVAEDPERGLLGFTLLILPSGQEEAIGRKVGVLDFIVVDPDCQGRGVGRLLLDQTHRLLADRGYEFVELKTLLDNRPAVNFYMNEGYRWVSSEVHYSLG